MKIVQVERLIKRGAFPKSDEWKASEKVIFEAIKAVDWPPGTGKFAINPVAEGNGVVPIKTVFVERLKARGWETEAPAKFAGDLQPGNLDFMLHTSHGPIALEWETGNISSSHRSMNKLALGLIQGSIVGGVMIVPSRALYGYLTDRVGNIQEIAPYFDFWKCIRCGNGVLEVVVFQHDKVSNNVPLIPKGKDGNAFRVRDL